MRVDNQNKLVCFHLSYHQWLSAVCISCPRFTWCNFKRKNRDDCNMMLRFVHRLHLLVTCAFHGFLFVRVKRDDVWSMVTHVITVLWMWQSMLDMLGLPLNAVCTEASFQVAVKLTSGGWNWFSVLLRKHCSVWVSVLIVSALCLSAGQRQMNSTDSILSAV